VPIAEITVPGSTSNLGASFDTCGLAVGLYLRVAVESRMGAFEIVATGEGSAELPRDESNLIARVARFVAEQRNRRIDGARLRIDNQVPLARGLGSSSAAIIAGISVYEVLADEQLDEHDIFRLALNFEGHGDNLAPGLLGGLVVACVAGGSLIAVKRHWPAAIRLTAVIPEIELKTEDMRRILPRAVPLEDAVFNLQRAALLQAALTEERFEVIGEALRDRLHQPFRAPLIPAAEGVLALNDQAARYPGLLGITISGAGSTVVAFSTGDTNAVAGEMVKRFAAAGIGSRALEMPVDNQGRRISFQ
jgi:homoserine kinase